MTQPNDGGPAFPQDLQGRRGDDPQYQGMSLRDWFAGQALVGIGASDLEHSYIWQRFSDDAPSPNGISELCYMIADAMLKARSANV